MPVQALRSRRPRRLPPTAARTYASSTAAQTDRAAFSGSASADAPYLQVVHDHDNP